MSLYSLLKWLLGWNVSVRAFFLVLCFDFVGWWSSWICLLVGFVVVFVWGGRIVFLCLQLFEFVSLFEWLVGRVP